MSKLSGTAYTYLVIMLVMIVLVVSSLELSYFASKLLPVAFAIIVFILSGVALGKDIQTRRKPKDSSCKIVTRAPPAEEIKGYLPIAAWIIGFSVGIYLVGFIIASVVFVGAYMKSHRSSWLASIITAIVCAGIIHFVFNTLLQSNLWPGIILDYISF